MQRPSRTQYKREVKEKVKQMRGYNRENNIRSNRIVSASFYRQTDPSGTGYQYVIRGNRNGEQFESFVSHAGERDRLEEVLIIFNTLTQDWKWQEPDCISFINLVGRLLTKNGDLKNAEKIMAMAEM